VPPSPEVVASRSPQPSATRARPADREAIGERWRRRPRIRENAAPVAVASAALPLDRAETLILNPDLEAEPTAQLELAWKKEMRLGSNPETEPVPEQPSQTGLHP